MPTMDAAAAAALRLPVIAPSFLLFLDIAGDPIRATTFGQDLTPAGTGDADLDGLTFSSVDSRVLQVSGVTHSEQGSDTVTVSLSGIVSIDTDLLNDVGDTSKWRGRLCRMWIRLYNEANTAQGQFFPYYTGYMSSVEIQPSPETQTILMKVENYLATFNQASNRSYLNQADYDPADTSAKASISSQLGPKSGASYGGGIGGQIGGALEGLFGRRSASSV